MDVLRIALFRFLSREMQLAPPGSSTASPPRVAALPPEPGPFASRKIDLKGSKKKGARRCFWGNGSALIQIWRVLEMDSSLPAAPHRPSNFG